MTGWVQLELRKMRQSRRAQRLAEAGTTSEPTTRELVIDSILLVRDDDDGDDKENNRIPLSSESTDTDEDDYYDSDDSYSYSASNLSQTPSFSELEETEGDNYWELEHIPSDIEDGDEVIEVAAEYPETGRNDSSEEASLEPEAELDSAHSTTFNSPGTFSDSSRPQFDAAEAKADAHRDYNESAKRSQKTPETSLTKRRRTSSISSEKEFSREIDVDHLNSDGHKGDAGAGDEFYCHEEMPPSP